MHPEATLTSTRNRKGEMSGNYRDDTVYLDQLAAADQRGKSRAAPRPARVKALVAAPAIELDPMHKSRSVSKIADRIDRVAAAECEADRARGRVRRGVSKAERAAGDGSEIGGTGFTILKRSDSPLTRLLNAKSIGREEMRAAEDITMAFHAMAGALLFRPVQMERQDGAHGNSERTALVDAVARYKSWAGIWSVRAKRGDPTLEIIIAAVIDERPLRAIEADLSIRNGAASRATAAGLRDYAARAGWAQGRASETWLVSSGGVFRLKRMKAA